MYIPIKKPARIRAYLSGYEKFPLIAFLLRDLYFDPLADARFYLVYCCKPVMLLFSLLMAAIARDAIFSLPAQAQEIPAVRQATETKQDTTQKTSTTQESKSRQSQPQNTVDKSSKKGDDKQAKKVGDRKAKQDSSGPAAGGDAEEDLINADRPGIANSSQVIGPRHFQIEIGIEQDLLGGRGSTSRLLTVPTLLRFGIDTRYELRIETAGFSSLSSPAPMTGTQHTQGLAPVSIGFKRQFQTSKGPAHPSIGTIVRFFPGSGSGAFRSNHFTGDALLAMDWDFMPKLSLNPNIGYAVYEDNAGKSFGNFHLANTLTYAPTTRLNFFVDFGLQSPETTGGNTSLIYDGGVTYILGRNIQLDVSVGTGILGKTVPHPFWATGVSVRF